MEGLIFMLHLCLTSYSIFHNNISYFIYALKNKKKDKKDLTGCKNTVSDVQYM